MAVPATTVETKGLRSAEDGKPLHPSTGFEVRGPAFDSTAVLAELKKKGAVVYSDVPNLRDSNPE